MLVYMIGGGGGLSGMEAKQQRIDLTRGGGTHHRTDSARKGANRPVGHNHGVNLDFLYLHKFEAITITTA